MKKFVSGLLAATMAATFAVASVAPVNAAPIFVPKHAQARSNVEHVEFRKWPRQNRVDRRFDRRIDRMDRREARRDFYHSGGRYYYNGIGAIGTGMTVSGI